MRSLLDGPLLPGVIRDAVIAVWAAFLSLLGRVLLAPGLPPKGRTGLACANGVAGEGQGAGGNKGVEGREPARGVEGASSSPAGVNKGRVADGRLKRVAAVTMASFLPAACGTRGVASGVEPAETELADDVALEGLSGLMTGRLVASAGSPLPGKAVGAATKRIKRIIFEFKARTRELLPERITSLMSLKDAWMHC